MPRRPRRFAGLLTAALAAAGVLAAPAAARTVAVPSVPDSASPAPMAGSYVPLASPSRVVDTRTGAAHNRRGALRAGRELTATIAGRGRVPRRGVGSVLVSVSALEPTGPGGLVVFGGQRPRTTNVQFAKGRPATNSAIVALSSGRLHVLDTGRRGTVQVVIDVLGYYRAGRPSHTEPGVYHPIAPRRLVDTSSGTGVRRSGALGPDQHIAPVLAGTGPGVPTSAGSVAVTVTVRGPTASGSILAAAGGEPDPPLPTVSFARGQSVSAFTVLGLGSGAISLVNRSRGRTQVLVDVVGWYSAGVPHSAHTFRAVAAQRVADRKVAGGHVLTVPVVGRAGVPRAKVAGVLVGLQAVTPTRSGTLQAWRAGMKVPRTTTDAAFAAHQTGGNVVLLPVSTTGKIAIRNSAKGATRIEVDVRGYVPANDVPSPDGTGLARYPNGLEVETTPVVDPPNSDPNYQTLSRDGSADAAGGADFVLLDLGAQSRTGPQLSKAHPGVAIAQTGNSPVRLDYPHLVAAIEGYLDGFRAASQSGNPPLTLALGTNNDGVFTGSASKYPAGPRGIDWATQLINPLRQYSADHGDDITVVGANDIEAAFAGTLAQAETWESAYLANTDADLIYNGDANDCPTTFGVTGKTCAYGWTQSDYYHLAHRGDRISVLPQIFFPSEAVKWANIDATGDGSGKGRLQFRGSLTEHALVPSELNSQQGRDALYRALSSVRFAPSVPRSVDIDTDR